jgi:16S rRNA (guanine527-N7)-methyltransferase
MGISMLDSRLQKLAGLMESWPGLVSAPAAGLIADCLVLVEHLGDARRLVDVGSGGGLPGLPLKIARPDLEVVLVEADRDKAAFLQRAAAELGLEGIEVLDRRAEDVGRDPRYRETFDAAVARALAAMPVVAELCLPLVRVGGHLLAQKTQGEDVDGAMPAIEKLGGGPARVVAAPSSARATGTVVIVEKLRPTPEAYPRRTGVPARKPL